MAEYSQSVSVDRDNRRPSALDFALFVDELLLLAVLVVAGAGIGGPGALRVGLAVVFPVAAAVVWGLWLAPRASRRLGNPAGIAMKVALFTIASALLAVAGSLLWAVPFWVVSVVLLVSAEMSTRRGHGGTSVRASTNVR